MRRLIDKGLGVFYNPVRRQAMYIDPTKQNVGFWYDWVWTKDGFGFAFSVETFLTLAERYQMHQTRAGEGVFTPPSLIGRWGVNGALESSMNDRGEVVTLVVSREYREKIAIAQTFAHLLPCLTQYANLPRQDNRKQLLILEGLGAKNQMARAQLGVTVTPVLATWLMSKYDDKAFWADLNRCMLETSHFDWGAEQLDRYEAEMRPRDTYLLPIGRQLVLQLSCNISIGPDYARSAPCTDGYRLTSNNFDTVWCQPPFLRTLARIHKHAREAGC